MIDFTSFIEANQDPAIVTNSTGQILEINKRGVNLLESTSEEVVGRNICDLFPVLNLVFDQVAGNPFHKYEGELDERYSSPTGKIRAFSIIPSELKFEGQSYFWFILKKSQSKKNKPGEPPDHIKYQLELEKIKERYQLAVEAGHNGIWDYSFKEKKLFVDDSLKSLLGYKHDEVINEKYFWDHLVAPDDVTALKEAIIKHVQDGKSYFEETFRMIHKRRVSLWVLGRGKIFYEKGEPLRIICSVTDITDKIKANEQLRNALINFKAIFDAFPDLFLRLNTNGMVIA